MSVKVEIREGCGCHTFGSVPSPVLSAAGGGKMALNIARQQKVCGGVWCNERGRYMTKLDQTIRHKCLKVHFQHLFRMYLCHPVRVKDSKSRTQPKLDQVNRESFHKS